MKKRVLVVGGGGREHALAWKISESPNLGKLFVAPGNAGTAKIAENVPIESTDVEGLLKFAGKKKIDQTIVGPDDPLALGIVDRFRSRGLRIFGPTKAAAQIESSKLFAKELMGQAGVPTVMSSVFTNPRVALVVADHHFSKNAAKPIVLKADGLALGKGVYICRTFTEAEVAIDEIMVRRIHSDAGKVMIGEDFVEGPEVSIHAFCDGKSFELFPPAQDHKAIFDGDQGPNTGGMGTIAPVPGFGHLQVVSDKVVRPILEKLKFSGLLYPGLKITDNGPLVLEYNARFGDPETQVYMRLLKSDLLEIFEACVDGNLDKIKIEWHPSFAVCVVLASAGYPRADYQKGLPITGIEKANRLPGVTIFQAGTKVLDGQLVTSGGRVLGVTAVGPTLEKAVGSAYRAVDHIHFEGMQYRKDIGAKFL